MLTRRDFLTRCASFGAAALLLSIKRGAGPLLAQVPSAAQGSKAPDIVAVKGGSQAARLDRALRELGGIGAFVRKGQTVVIKPNIGWSQGPEVAANTDPELVARLVEHCLEAGASKVWVFDHSCDNGPSSYRASKIEGYAKAAGAVVVPGESSSYYQEVPVPGARSLKKTRVHELILAADAFINVPVLKDHSGAGMTCAMKNLMGIVWDRSEFHRLGLDQCIADACLFRKPTLSIVDAGRVMLSGGPRGYPGSRYGEQRMLIASTDIVALDAVSARTLGRAPSDFEYIAKAEERGLGTSDTSRLAISRLTI
ncbi:MAG TPA: DUF362 domain-containing protein [Spirochaetales bacterium]|nr:DUF362 domain-containing protein [Spirochaetales bacterium]HRY54916.1 DUF362 domain-containing protein [Spirochaetia bacterium]HRZ63503.1 DUF362 domain-containing protein [Spirochaetia bacterium]